MVTILANMIATTLVGAALLGLIAGFYDPGMRKALRWIVGLSGTLFGIGVLLCVFSPAPEAGAWFTRQQETGAGLSLLSVCSLGLTGLAAFCTALHGAAYRQWTATLSSSR